MRRGRFAAIGVFLVAASCRSAPPPGGQVVLYVDTDAPLPTAQGTPAIAPLFDQLRVDVYPPGAKDPCSECTRVVPATTEAVASGQESLGITIPPRHEGYVVRVRLFRAVATHEGEPNRDSSIDVMAALPAVGDEGITECSLMLHTDDVASPVGSLDQPIAVTPGRVTQGHPGTWPGARRVDCVGSARDGEVCVPGGAYWMGNPLVAEGFGSGAAANLQRLVVVSPFFLDAHEVTVKEYRDEGGDPTVVTAWTGSHAGASAADWCTFTAQPSANDGLPLSCISSQDARRFCQKVRGADLPSEAQFEYAASGLRGALYPWGDEDPVCGEAAFGLAGFGVFDLGVGTCRDPATFGGVLPPLRMPRTDRDQLALAGGTILDLAGNLGEWVVDRWDEQDGPCWGTGIFRDPVCTTSASSLSNVRGGDWGGAAVDLRAAHRGAIDATAIDTSPEFGVRCARADM